MIITGITHASAREKDQNFRGLTEAGRVEASGAAERYLTEVGPATPPPIGQIISSPKPRCIETVILFAKGLTNDYITASNIELDVDIKAGSVSANDLVRLARSSRAEHLLVSGHADLAKALPRSARLIEQAVKDGWFAWRPVLFQIEYERGMDWDDAQLLFCEAMREGSWNRIRRR